MNKPILGERKVHKLKTLNPYFEDVYNQAKTFEVRRNDRDFKVDDILELNEWTGTEYTGRSLAATVKYILSDPNYCKDGFVILGIHISSASRPEPEPPHAEESEVDKAMRVVVKRKFEEGERWNN